MKFKKISKTISLLLSAILLATSLVACNKVETTGAKETGEAKTETTGDTKAPEISEAAQSNIDAIKERDKLIVGVFGDKPPFGYIDQAGKNVGYDVYFAHRLAKDLLGDENKIEFVILDGANRIEFLKSNKVDIVLANFTVTDERKEQVDFALPYMKVALGVVAKDGSGVESIDDLKGKQLIVNKGTTAELYFAENYPDIELLGFDHNTEAFQALVDGRADAMSHDNMLLFAWTFENKGFQVIDGNIGNQDYIAPAVKKGNTDLLNWINQEIEALGQENFFHADFDAELKDKFSSDTKPDDVVIEGGKTN